MARSKELKCRIFIPEDELVELKRHAHQIPECPGLEERIQRYNPPDPLVVEYHELEWLIAVLDAVLTDPNGYPCIEFGPWQLEYVPDTDQRCLTCKRLYDRLEKAEISLQIEKMPKEFHGTLKIIIDLIDTFCSTHLNGEYRELAHVMAISVCRNKVPVKSGKPQSWASGIVHALGWVNFLQDRDTQPYMSSVDVAKGFGVSQATMMAKSRIVRDMLGLIPLHPDWCTSERLEHNPLVWMLEMNGIVMDIRTAPREVQEVAYAQGLIPFIPDDEPESSSELNEHPKIIELPNIRDRRPEPKPADNLKDDHPTLF